MESKTWDLVTNYYHAKVNIESAVIDIDGKV